MANSTVMKSLAPQSREIPHTVSPGLWALAWKRLIADRVAVVSLVIVCFFLIMMLLSGTGLVAGDWAREVGVNYAPPSFLGAEAETSVTTSAAPATTTPTPAVEFKSSVVDPLGQIIAELRGEKKAGEAAASASTTESGQSIDPL